MTSERWHGYAFVETDERVAGTEPYRYRLRFLAEVRAAKP